MSNAITYYVGNQVYSVNVGNANYIQQDPFLTLTSPNKGLSFPYSTTITLSSRRVNYQPTTLGTTTHVYYSPQYQDIIGLSNYFADWGCAYDTTEGPTHVISVQIPWDTISGEDFTVSQFASEQWELVPNTEQKSIIVNGLLTNPFVQPSVQNNYVAFPDVLKVGIQTAFENKQSIITIPATSTGSAAQLAPFLPYAQQVLNYMRGGIEGVPSYTQTLKRTAVIDSRNSNGAFQTAADNQRNSLNANGSVNFILSTADLQNQYEVQNAVMPFMYPSYRKQITITGLEPAQYYSYAGWLVKPPLFQFITRNKVQLTQEFIWNEWIGGLYYINSSPNSFPLVVSPSNSPSGFMPH